jgi:hypothetical protein
MNVGVVSAWSSQHVMVSRRVGDLLADIDHRPINDDRGAAAHKTVNERGVRISINLLDPTGDLSWLRPVVIFHRDHENGLDVGGMSIETAPCTDEDKRSQDTVISGL